MPLHLAQPCCVALGPALIQGLYLITIFLPLSEKGSLPGSFSAHFMVNLLAHKIMSCLGIAYLNQLMGACHTHTYYDKRIHSINPESKKWWTNFLKSKRQMSYQWATMPFIFFIETIFYPTSELLFASFMMWGSASWNRGSDPAICPVPGNRNGGTLASCWSLCVWCSVEVSTDVT